MRPYPPVKGRNSRGFSNWVYPRMGPKGWKLRCCDCGLVHEFQFEVAVSVGRRAYKVKDPLFDVAFRVRRLNRETVRMRKGKR